MRIVAVIIVVILLLPFSSTEASGTIFQIRPITDKPSSKAIKMLDRKGHEYLILNDVLATESDLDRAYISEESDIKGKFRITVFFKRDKAYKLYDLTKKYVGQCVAIVINKKVITTPKIFEPIKGDSFTLSTFSHLEAKNLAEQLNSAIEKRK